MSNEENREAIRRRYREEKDLSKVTIIPPRQEIDPFDELEEKRVVVYSRVSTDGIAQVSSIELQKNYYMQYVQRHPGWRLVGIYSDEGGSGTNMEKRNALLQMLEDARDGKFDMIIIKSLSRLARNLMDSMKIVYELRELPNPVGIYSETENMFTLDQSADFTLQIISLIAQEESHKKSEAMMASYQQRFATANFMKPDVLGYDKTGVNELAINGDEAKTVTLIFKMFLAGYEAKLIAEVLKRLKRKKHTHIYKDGRRKEGNIEWTEDSVLAVLENEKSCGDVIAQKTYTVNYLTHLSKKNNNVLPKYHAKEQHPAIVSREEYQTVKKIQKIRRTGIGGEIPRLYVWSEGILKGFIISDINDHTFDIDDYNQASDSVYKNSNFGNLHENYPERRITKEYKIVSQEAFNTNSQPILTIDKNGFFFNYQCRRFLSNKNYIQIAYHPGKRMLLIIPADSNDECRISWVKEDKKGFKMHRIPFKSLSRSIYENMEWNLNLKYRLFGHLVRLNNDRDGIEFSLENNIVVLGKEYLKNNDKEQVTSSRNALSRNLRELVNPSKAYELDNESDSDRGKRSHAIYFETVNNEQVNIGQMPINIEQIGIWIKSKAYDELSSVKGRYEISKLQNGTYTIADTNIYESCLTIPKEAQSMRNIKESVSLEECGWTAELKLLEKDVIIQMIHELAEENSN